MELKGLLYSQAYVLKRLRFESGLILKDLSKKTLINYTRLHRLESGRATLAINEIITLQKFYRQDLLKIIANHRVE